MQPRGQRVGRQQLLVQGRRRHVGDDGLPGPHGQPGGGVHGHGPAAAHLDRLDVLPGAGSAPRPMLRADPARRPARRCRRPAPGTRSAGPAWPAASRRCRCPARPAVRRRVPRCRPAAAGRASDANSSSPIRRAGSSRNRASRRASAVPARRSSCTGPRTGGNGGEQGAQQRLPDPVPLLAQPQPGLPVAGVVRGQPGRGVVAVAVQHGGRAVVVRAGRVSEHARCVCPAQAVALKIQCAQHRRRGRQRVERAEQVGGVAGVQLVDLSGSRRRSCRWTPARRRPTRHRRGRRRRPARGVRRRRPRRRRS